MLTLAAWLIPTICIFSSEVHGLTCWECTNLDTEDCSSGLTLTRDPANIRGSECQHIDDKQMVCVTGISISKRGTFIGRSCEHIDKNKSLGCEALSIGNTRAEKCYCDTDWCNVMSPTSRQHSNSLPTDPSSESNDQSKTSATTVSTTLASVRPAVTNQAPQNTDKQSQDAQLNLELKTKPTWPTARTNNEPRVVRLKDSLPTDSGTTPSNHVNSLNTCCLSVFGASVLANFFIHFLL